MWLCNSGTESVGKLFKYSNDSASLVVSKEKNFCWGYGFFMSYIIAGGHLGHLGPLYLALGPNR